MAITFEIHPAIGIARVGTSNDFFIGPEPGVPVPTTYRDAGHDLLRQAARFRVFQCDRDSTGNLTSAVDVTPTATINWTVRLANRKGVALQFAPLSPSASGRRNNATGNNANPLDQSLTIGPVSQSATGKGTALTPFPLGQFKGVNVKLGDLATDTDGAVLVLGGNGVSDSIPSRGTGAATPPLQSFADSDDWFDDVSDGSVEATILLPNGSTPTVRSAWVIVTPPDFAPPVTNLVTLYDIGFQVAVDAGWLKQPSPVSFTQHVKPILERAVGYRSVNRTARISHGASGFPNFSLNWTKLSDKSTSGPIAARVLARLRPPGSVSPPGVMASQWMPRLHDENNNQQVLPLTPTQYSVLTEWSLGNYNDDLSNPPVSGELLPDALDRVALQACAGGAFFPGIEVGRIMKQRTTYAGTFRIDPTLEPGTLTAGNALPWQADFAACRWEQQIRMAWWPAQRPDQVMIDPTTEKDWGFGVSSDIDMVNHWSELGIVFKQDVDPATGQPIFLEKERTLARP